MEKALQWKETTSWIFKSVLLFSLSNVLAAVLKIVAVLMTLGKAASSNSITDVAESAKSGLDTIDTIETICTIAVLAGYVLFFIYIGKLRTLVHNNDENAVAKIRTAFILNMVAAGLSFLPLISIIGLIVNVVAWFILLGAYARLRDSQTFPEMARRGMRKLHTAMILTLIGGIIGIIPLIGFIGSILTFIAFIMTITGWKKLSDSEAPVC